METYYQSQKEGKYKNASKEKNLQCLLDKEYNFYL